MHMIAHQEIETATGEVISVKVDTLCIHGDTPGAVHIARKVRTDLELAGIKVAPFTIT